MDGVSYDMIKMLNLSYETPFLLGGKYNDE